MNRQHFTSAAALRAAANEEFVLCRRGIGSKKARSSGSFLVFFFPLTSPFARRTKQKPGIEPEDRNRHDAPWIYRRKTIEKIASEIFGQFCQFSESDEIAVLSQES
ncbi:MAG: hypothetical protein WC840_02775 [Candidatus Peribacteraceae bacterium]